MLDDMAREFDKNLVEKMETPMIIVVTTCRVSRYRDLQLSASLATYYYFNLDILEVKQSQAEYMRKHNLNPPLTVCKYCHQNPNKDRLRNRYSLALLLQQNPDTYQASGIVSKLFLDETGTTLFTFFTPVVDALTRHQCPELVCQLGIPNPQEIPPKVLVVEGSPMLIELAKFEDLGKPIVRGETRFRSAKRLTLQNSTNEGKKKKVE
ncbi:hypothetical protein Tco_1328919 [Tanacetum coccineum]